MISVIYLLNAVLVTGLMNPNEAQETNLKKVDRLLDIESLATAPRRELFVDYIVDGGTSVATGGASLFVGGVRYVEGWGEVGWEFAEGPASDGVNHIRKAGHDLAKTGANVANVFADVSFGDMVHWIQEAFEFFHCSPVQNCFVSGIDVTGCTPGNSQCIVEYSGPCLAISRSFRRQNSFILAENDNSALTVSAKAEAEVTTEAAVILYLDNRAKVRVELTPPVVAVDAQAKFELTAASEFLNKEKRIALSTPYQVVRKVFMAGPIPVLVVVTAQPVAILTAYGDAKVTGTVTYNARGTVTFRNMLWAEINLQNMQVNHNFDSLLKPQMDTEFQDHWTFDATGELGIEFAAAIGVELSISVYETAEFNLFPAVKGALKTSGMISSTTVADLKAHSQSFSGVINAHASAEFCVNGEVTGYFDWKQQAAGRRELAELDFAAAITASCDQAANEMCPLAGFVNDIIPICSAVGQIITSLGFPTLVLPNLNALSLSVNIPGTCSPRIDLVRRGVGFHMARIIGSRDEPEEIQCPVDYVGYKGMMSGPGLLNTATTTSITTEQACETECAASTICNTFEWDSVTLRCYIYTEGEDAINTGIHFNNKICTRITHTCPLYFRHIAGDILGWGFNSKRANDEQDCANWCDGIRRCKAFQFSATMDGKNCALHDHANINAHTASDMHMCVNIRTCRRVNTDIPDNFAGNPRVWPHIDYPDAPYLGGRVLWEPRNGFRGVGVTLDMCQHACGITVGCKAYQFDTQYGQCWLLRRPNFFPGHASWTGYVCEEFSQDCEVEWSICNSDCVRTPTIVKPKIGALGAECQLNAPVCSRGEGLCPLRTCSIDGAHLCDHPSLVMDSSILCTGSECSESECCKPKASCETYTGTCASPSLRLLSVQLCPGDETTCNDQICCAPQQTCASYQGTCHRKPDDTPCEGISCTFDDCCQECVGYRNSFSANYGNCFTYTQSGGNFPYCGEDNDQTTNKLASQVCPECLQCSQRECTGDRSTWNGGYGGCETYTSGTENFDYCHSDVMGGVVAGDVCSECATCRDN